MLARLAVLVLFGVLPGISADWSPRLAADYLDSRQKEWFAWPTANASAQPCVSCHTGVTYLLARPALRRALGETEPTSFEKGLAASLRKRVASTSAAELFPNSKEPRASEALGVESVFAALFLVGEDSGHRLTPDARRAFDRLWSLQIREGRNQGAFAWFSLDLDPWEMPESTFYGATLAAIAAGSAPSAYRDIPEVRGHVSALTAYLRREQESEPLHNRAMWLWAAAALPEAAEANTRQAILDEIWSKQQPDGGWTLHSLGPWKEHAAAPAAPGGSDSYASALITLALRKAAVAPADPKLRRALDWLRSHQDSQTGYWPAQSMNKQYKPDSMQIRFMQDAATAYSALALLN